jgi:hypothetical protein
MIQSSFQFLADDRRQWTASLQPVSHQMVGWIFGQSTIDPDFIFVGPDRHQDDHIQYVTPDGSRWSSKCHSHTDPVTGVVNFTFEHTPMSGVGVHHEDTTLNVVSWKKESLWISCPNVGPFASGQSVHVNFDIRVGGEPVRI